jgi:hypothetical protein
MKTRFLSGVLGVISASLVLTVPVFAHDSHDRGRRGDHNSSYGGHVDRDYRSGGHGDRNYSYRGYGDHAYRERPYYGHESDSYADYGHRSGASRYWGKDARHHRRGHRHHHGF